MSGRNEMAQLGLPELLQSVFDRSGVTWTIESQNGCYDMNETGRNSKKCESF